MTSISSRYQSQATYAIPMLAVKSNPACNALVSGIDVGFVDAGCARTIENPRCAAPMAAAIQQR